ncbi:ATP phosphoribosyltransferase [Caldivirga sp.]|uniref:ATP phosphoribosyltransferase n=1 Tax=Caldivirga sp. TaxID=2080243 RepID=UPI0025BF8B8A|nr:ATP phosphoribosyltransferase [Caldivirga sp.]
MAVPSKGRLMEPVMGLLEYIGVRPQAMDDRSLVIPTSWRLLSLIRIRPEDIPSVVESGSAVMGITGLDYVTESGASVNVIERLGFGRGKIVVAVPYGSGVSSIDDVKDGMRLATKYVNITNSYFSKLGKRIRIVKISGSAEVMPLLNVADGIVDVMSTGTTLRLHGLKPIGVIMESEAALITPRELSDDEKEFVDKFLILMRGALASNGRKLVLMNVPEEDLAAVLKVLPAMEGPTIADVASGRPMKEVISVVPEESIPDLLPLLKKAGAKDILVLSIEKVIP